MRVVIIRDYVKAHFPSTPLLDYALEVEKITTSKVTIFPPPLPLPPSLPLDQQVFLQLQKPNLILNVDGVIAVSFVDLLRQSGAFTPLVRCRDVL